MLSLVFGSATHSFELMLSAFILGLALGSVWVRKHADRWKNPVRALGILQWIMGAAALATLRLVRDGYAENARVQGERLRNRLMELQKEVPEIGDVRGLGLMVGAEIVRGENREKAPDLRDAVIEAAFRRGLLLLGCGDNSVRFSPPLLVDSEQIDTAFEIFRESLQEARSS